MDATAAIDGGADLRETERRARRAAAYRAAMRHSRFVRVLKWLIPLGAGLATLAVIGIMVFDPFRRLPGALSMASISMDGTRIVMESPRLQGFRSDARPYEVTAKSAEQDVRSPHIVDLKDLDANLAIGQEGSARVVSPAGRLDSQKETLDLREAVRVTTDTGYDVRMKSARVEFKAGHVVSSEPVVVRMNDGVIEADGLEIVEGGRQIIFNGRVRSVLTPRGAAAGDQTATAGEAKR